MREERSNVASTSGCPDSVGRLVPAHRRALAGEKDLKQLLPRKKISREKIWTRKSGHARIENLDTHEFRTEPGSTCAAVRLQTLFDLPLGTSPPESESLTGMGAMLVGLKLPCPEIVR